MFKWRDEQFGAINLLYSVCGIIVIFMLAFSIVLFAQSAYAGNTTDSIRIKSLPGKATLAGSPEINVTVSYTGDDTSSNNSITIEWGLDGDDFTLGSQVSGVHPASPYSYTIAPLDNSKVYQIRVTVTDPDNVPTDHVKIFNGQKPYNPMIHNAVSTGSDNSKWASGWGIDGGQYGEFTCAVCHQKKSGNIKRIRKDWTDASVPQVPIKTHAAGETVEYNSAQDGTAELADDDTSDHNTTDRICEACHTRTSYHQHDMTAIGADHNSTKNCRACHPHNEGFKPKGCSSCHGGNFDHSNNTYDGTNYWPDSGSDTSNNDSDVNDSGEHVKHMMSLSDKVLGLTLEELLSDSSSHDKQVQLCNLCHANPGSDGDHTSGFVAEVRFLQPDADADAGTAATYSATADTCNNVDCHNGKNVQAANNWYAGSNGNCLLCHTQDNSNGEAINDPTSGLHLYSASYTDVEGHDANFDSGAGTCTTCHQADPSSGHFNSVADTPATATFNFQSSVAIDVKLNTLADTTDDTCAADCHTDQGYWYRKWSQDAYFTFDPATFDNTNPLPAGCDVCHGMFGSWAEGSSHAGTYDGIASTKGSSHNGPDEPGTKCEDCHVFPSEDYHNNGQNKITLNDSNGLASFEGGNGINPVYNGTDDVWSCEPCHTDNPLPPISNSYAFPDSDAFDIERISGAYVPSGSCFSGEWTNSCHGYIDEGSGIERWWPEADPRLHDDLDKHPGDPANELHDTINFGYPNRAGAHHEHNITIGELVCSKRTGKTCTADPTDNAVTYPDPTDEDYNSTCIFCHPMTVEAGVLKATNHYDGVVDVYGGYTYDDLQGAGIDKGRGMANSDPASGSWTKYDVIPGDGYIYQLDDPNNPGAGVYPLDTDGEYRQYLYNYATANNVNHGTCSNVACHSNAPFTPNWFGDDQAPAQITTLRAYTSAADFDAAEVSYYDGVSHYSIVGLDDDCKDVPPGAVLLTWLAPGDNGNFDGTAYEYEVYYSNAVINDANVDSATRVGGAPTVHRQDELQCMIVDGLTAENNYYFAVRTKDQPKYVDTDDDGIFEKWIEDGKISSVAATTSTVSAHVDDVAPVFWGLNQVQSHDTGGTINLSWDAARDHTLPLTYLVYWSDYALKTHLTNGETMPVLSKPAQYDGGVYSFNYTDPSSHKYTIYATTTSGMTYQVKNLGIGVLYNFMVRAEDGHDPVGNGTGIGNIDDNTVVSMAMANTMAQEPINTIMAVLNGNTGMSQTDPLNPSWGSTGSATLSNNQSFTVTDSADLDGAASRDIWMQGISIDMTVTNGDRKLPQEFQVQLGYDNGSFNAIGSPVVVGIGRKSSRVIKVGLANIEGRVPANSTLALRVTSTVPSSGSTATITFQWGSDSLKGQLMVTAQQINHQPSAPAMGALSRATGGYIDINWTPSNDGSPSDGGQPLHYDVFGSADNGTTWPFVIGTDLTDADGIAGVRWDTVGDGLDSFHAGNYPNVKVKVEASDGFLFETANADGTGGDGPGSGYWFSHVSSEGSVAINNSSDDESPSAVEITHIEPRPKQGAAYLHWLAVGNDGDNHGTRAAYYDVRFRKTSDGALTSVYNSDSRAITGGTWTDPVATVQAGGEPVPGFAGTAETFELLNMVPDTSYYVAVSTCDESGNCSDMSNVYTITSGQYYCGICHSTPPDEPETGGVHRQHGYTLEDCAKCHGDGTSSDGNDVMSYDGRHYDGVINVGWAEYSDGTRATLVELGPESGGTDVVITQNNGANVKIYEDLNDGAGGYNADTAYNPSSPLDNTDSGKCMNFGSANATGCHGPFEPKWASDTEELQAIPTCADCHGDKTMTANDDAGTELGRLTDPYGRQWDQVDTSQAKISGYYPPEEELLASPPIDNHDLGGKDTRYTGAHLRHLNASFRFAKGDSCRLCHRDTMESGLHANRVVDVVFDSIADQDEGNAAVSDDTPADVDTKGVSCSSLNNLYCHDTGARWAEPGTKCNSCHGMASKSYTVGAASSEIGHVMGQAGVVEECTYCHVAGHPQSPDGINSGDSDTLLINNNAVVGINYKSGGIHLKRSYPWGTYTTLAEICWGCHDQNNDGDLNDANDISEWGTNTSAATGSSGYNFGTLSQKQWTGAVWSSGYGQTSSDPFWYKRGYIQSTHTTDPSGGSTVSWDGANGRYNEVSDSIDKIRCSNCHDVHDSNLAPGDTMSGRPYLRGTWKANPYEEDGAPWSKDYADNYPTYTFGAVPRGGAGYGELGGYYIDQNNVVPGTGNSTQDSAQYPTSGWTLGSSAGLCALCHGYDVEEMDQKLGEALWLGANGHSNSALGGDFTKGADIFNFSHGRPTPNFDTWGLAGRPKDTDHWSMLRADMAYLTQGGEASAGGGYRGNVSQAGMYSPSMRNQTTNPTYPLGFNYYDWGASVDADTTDNMYHQFSCSKCHNPHASRLPKLMITNCLDIRHNTWDDTKSSLQTKFTASELNNVDRNQRAAYYASAQNCHRFDPARTSAERGGWNKVTPWVNSNLDNSEHKGSSDTAYGDTSPTYHKFPTESTGW